MGSPKGSLKFSQEHSLAALSECRECTCKIDKSLNRRMCNKFESRKICVAGNQCDNSDFDFHNAEHRELPEIKISSVQDPSMKEEKIVNN